MTSKAEIHKEIERLAFQITKYQSPTDHHTDSLLGDRHRPQGTPENTHLYPAAVAQLTSRLNYLEWRLDGLERVMINQHRTIMTLLAERER